MDIELEWGTMRNTVSNHIANGGTAAELILLVAALVIFIIAALMAFTVITATATVTPIALIAAGLALLAAAAIV